MDGLLIGLDLRLEKSCIGLGRGECCDDPEDDLTLALSFEAVREFANFDLLRGVSTASNKSL